MQSVMKDEMSQIFLWHNRHIVGLTRNTIMVGEMVKYFKMLIFFGQRLGETEADCFYNC